MTGILHQQGLKNWEQETPQIKNNQSTNKQNKLKINKWNADHLEIRDFLFQHLLSSVMILLHSCQWHAQIFNLQTKQKQNLFCRFYRRCLPSSIFISLKQNTNSFSAHIWIHAHPLTAEKHPTQDRIRQNILVYMCTGKQVKKWRGVGWGGGGGTLLCVRVCVCVCVRVCVCVCVHACVCSVCVCINLLWANTVLQNYQSRQRNGWDWSDKWLAIAPLVALLNRKQ